MSCTPGDRPFPTVTFGGSNLAEGAPEMSGPVRSLGSERLPGERSWVSPRPDPTLVRGASSLSGPRLALPARLPLSAPRRLPLSLSRLSAPPPGPRRESPQSRSELFPLSEPPEPPGSAIAGANPEPPSRRNAATTPTPAARRGFDRATVPLPRVAKTCRRRAQCILTCRCRVHPGSSTIARKLSRSLGVTRPRRRCATGRSPGPSAATTR